MQILYITFIDFDNIHSGSGMRPYKMYEAFLELGLDVKLLECQQNKRKERREKVREVLEWLNYNKPDFCYIEPPTGPFFNTIDLTLMKKVHEKKIPIGLFYRDAYWTSREMWKVPAWKRFILTRMHKRDNRIFQKTCKIVYVMSEEFESLLREMGFQNIDMLPPGGSEKYFEDDRFDDRNCIYVGGTSEAYGGLKLIRAFSLLNAKKTISTLTFISPETKAFNKLKYDYPWLHIKHTFDREEVEASYKKATFAMIPFKKIPYMDMAVPVKTYEYIGYGIPVIATNCTAISKVLKKHDCGIVCPDSEEAIQGAVKTAFSNHDEYLRLKSNTIKAGRKNRWIDRAEKVVQDLTEIPQ